VSAGDEVYQGQLIAEIRNPYDGELKQNIVSPCDGVVFFIHNAPLVYADTAVIKIVV
jgi:hypothetical protein